MGMRRRLGLGVAGLALAAGPLAAQAEPRPAARTEASLDEILEPIRAEFEVPALAALVLRDGEVRAIGSAGLRSRGDEARVTVDDLWHLGSCTKAMTATLCATLVAEGRIAWDTSLAAAFPELGEDLHEGFREVTLRQLLQHRAGLPANPTRDGLWRELYAWDGPTRAARERVVRDVLGTAPEHAPGSAFLYSNTGYMVAGAVAERVTGRSWEELMQERVFAPLGITTAGFGPPGSAEHLDQPRAHRGRLRGIAPGPTADNPPALGPAGTVHMSLRDWARFVALHLGALDGEAAILDAERLAELHEGVGRDGAEPYALGWGVAARPWAEGPVLTHAGSNTMWFAVVWADPASEFAVLAVSNQGGDQGAQATDRACAALIGRFGPRVGR
jgi:CubicO group peptidase (beta-lactamase class C family)